MAAKDVLSRVPNAKSNPVVERPVKLSLAAKYVLSPVPNAKPNPAVERQM